MTYGQVKRLSLQKIYSDTIAGEVIESSYNNQADYEIPIPGLVNDAMTYIATTVKRIPAITKLEDLNWDEEDQFYIYYLPEDCYEIMNGGLILPFRENQAREVSDRYRKYRLYGANQLWLPKNAPKGLYLEYYRFPAMVDSDTPDDTELDNTPDTHAAIPYYVAAQLVMYDDAFRYASLYNDWENRLGRLKEQTRVEESHVRDVYGFGFGPDSWW